MSFLNVDLINRTSALHPKPDFHFTYGTAGFREKYVLLMKFLSKLFSIILILKCKFKLCSADLLDSVVFRIGLLAVLRSKVKNGRE